jgi:hypothetical protein
LILPSTATFNLSEYVSLRGRLRCGSSLKAGL